MEASFLSGLLLLHISARAHTPRSCLHVLVEESMYEDFADFQDKGGKRPIPCKDEHEMNKSKMCC